MTCRQSADFPIEQNPAPELYRPIPKSQPGGYAATLTSITALSPYYFKTENFDKSPPAKKPKVTLVPPPEFENIAHPKRKFDTLPR